MRSGPELSLKAQAAIGATLTTLCLWTLPGPLKQWTERLLGTASVQARAQQVRDTELARRYAAVIAACLNGQSITDGELIVQCRRVQR